MGKKTGTAMDLFTGGEPKAPDPNAMIEAQKNANQYNQYTPNGNTIYGSVDANGNFVAKPNAQAIQVTESPFNRQLREKAQNLGINFADQISPTLGGVSSAQQYRNALNNHGASVEGLRGGLTSLQDPNAIKSGLVGLNSDFSGDARQAQDATFNAGMGLLQPQLDLQRRRTEQSLADKGLPMGAEAYTGEMGRLDTNQGQQLNQLALASVLAGNNRQNELFGQNLSTRQQGFNENDIINDRFAQQRQQQFGENKSTADFDLRKQGWLAGLESQQRSAQYNELASLLGLQQVPQFQSTPQVDAAGIIQQGYDTQSKNAQAKNAAMGQMAASGAQMAMMAGSDRRLKENIVKVGEKGGINIYEFNYIDKPERYRGVMAQEVEHIPDAVHTLSDGYLAVNYQVLDIPFERIDLEEEQE